MKEIILPILIILLASALPLLTVVADLRVKLRARKAMRRFSED